MARYYSVAVLPPVGVAITDDAIRVNLDTMSAIVEDDVQMVAARGQGNYLYLSGGGTLLLNNRYLLIVQRDTQARINPDVWSLFTGRADGVPEWEQPQLVVRELFEELLLYKNGALVKPVCAAFQSVIDAVYAKLTPKETLALTPLPLPSKTLTVTRGSQTLSTTKGHVVIGAKGDVHLLFVFAVDMDISALTAEDGEHGTQGIKRNIAALDLKTMQMLDVTIPQNQRKWLDTADVPMSEHLRGLIQQLEIP